jgi:peptidylprolyl isomerase domain and WD repeat-containing protein 1
MLLARTGGSSAAVGSDEAKKKVNDSLLITLAFKKRRLYIFSNVDPFATAEGESKDNNIDHQDIILSRDVLNEPPDIDDLMIAANQKEEEKNRFGNEAVLRTTLGDIHIRLFPQETPRTVENFCGHARSGYYDNVIFHRVIKVNKLYLIL